MMARDNQKIDSPGPDGTEPPKYPMLDEMLRAQPFAFDGKPREGAASDVGRIMAVASEWYRTPEGKRCTSDRQATTLAFSRYWELWQEKNE